MIIILVLAMFVAFLVVKRFINNKAPKYDVQTASRAEAGAREVQPIVEGNEVPEHRRIHQVRGIDRRQADRRGRGSQSAA
jgi:hypothetical protein